MTRQRARRGYVLVLAILALVVVGGLIVATHVAVNLEHSMAAAAVNRQRAFAASEHGLWTSVSEWGAANFTLAPGGATTKVVRVLRDSAVVTIVRLNDRLYWVVADAAVGDARRRTAVNVRVIVDSTGSRVEPVRRSWVELH